jgi:hypothetical protein
VEDELREEGRKKLSSVRREYGLHFSRKCSNTKYKQYTSWAVELAQISKQYPTVACLGAYALEGKISASNK